MPTYRFRGARAFTNKPPGGPKRGHGTTQPRFAVEVHLDKIAEELKLDPAELRLRHLVKPNTVTANWLQLGTMGLARLHRQGGGGVPLEGALPEAARTAADSGSPALLTSPAPASRSTGTTCRTPASQIKCDRGGGVTIFCGSIDIGQGSESVLALS